MDHQSRCHPDVEHPRSLYLREDKVIELIDPWIGRAFAPHNLRTTLDAMVAAQHDDTEQHRIITAKEKIATCDSKLSKYRAALEAGTDPALVQQWITQVQAERAVAEAELRHLTGRRTMTADEISTIVDALSGISAILKTAEATDKAEVCRQLGLNLKYEPGLRKIKAEASPNGSCSSLCPRIDTAHRPTAFEAVHAAGSLAMTGGALSAARLANDRSAPEP